MRLRDSEVARSEFRCPRPEVRGLRPEAQGPRSEVLFRGPTSEVPCPRSKVQGPRPEEVRVRPPRSEVRGPGSEVRGPSPRSEVRRPTPEVRGPGSGVRGPRFEFKVRGPRLTPEVRGPRCEVRGPRSAAVGIPIVRFNLAQTDRTRTRPTRAESGRFEKRIREQQKSKTNPPKTRTDLPQNHPKPSHHIKPIQNHANPPRTPPTWETQNGYWSPPPPPLVSGSVRRRSPHTRNSSALRALGTYGAGPGCNSPPPYWFRVEGHILKFVGPL